VKEFKNETDWQQLIHSTHESFMQVAKAAANFPEEKLDETYAADRSSYYKNCRELWSMPTIIWDK
jgi:hypothetical protein